MLNRLASARRYLSFAAPLWEWRLRRGRCPLCGSVRFLELAGTPSMTRCLGCRTNSTNLSPLRVIEDHLGSQLKSMRTYELSSYGALFEYLSTRSGEFFFSEYLPNEPLGQVINGIRNEDVQHLTFSDGFFDLVTSNQVLEHIPDDLAGFRECCRVLKMGGLMIATIPVYDLPSSEHLAELDEDGNIRWLGTPEYHDSRAGGPMSAPVFWRHSTRDVADRLRSAGFSHAELVDVRICDDQRVPQKVVYARK
jgi:SAM-dependent methyltransferase